MNSAKKIHTLWVDDRPDDNLIDNCWDEGIRIEKAFNSNEGMAYLHSNWKDIDFIILDARGTREGDVTDGDTGGVYDMLSAIQQYRREKRIPYCIYTAYIDDQKVKELKNQYPELKLIKKNDPKTNNPIFDPYRELIDYIISESSKSEERQIKNMYADVLDAADSLCFSEGYKNTLMLFLKSLSFDSHRDKCPGPEDMRDIIEYVCKRYYEAGLIPRECFKTAGNKLTEINITDAMKYLCGEKPDNVYGKKDPMGVFDIKGPVLPVLMTTLMDTSLNYTQKCKHDGYRVADEDVIDINQKLNDYEMGIKTPLYKFSALLNLCDFIQYSAEYISNHRDVDENRSRCIRLANECVRNQEGNPTRICVVEQDQNNSFHVGNYIKLSMRGVKGTVKVPVKEGDKIIITRLSVNSDRTDPYRFFAADYTIQ